MHFSNNTVIFENIISYNTFGIRLCYQSTNITFYFNDIFGNEYQVYGGSYDVNFLSKNQFDNGTAGNYWENYYVIKYPDAINGGIFWNIPFEINYFHGIDYYPLVNSIFPDVEAPFIRDIPEDIFKIDEYKNVKILWTAFDAHPSNYTIELDGIEMVSTTTLTNGAPIYYNIPDDLPKGDHNITIIISDESGNKVSDTAIFILHSWIPYAIIPFEGFASLF